MKINHPIRSAIIIASLVLLNSCSSPTCENSIPEYQDGYASGKLVKIMGGGSGSCSAYVDSYNEKTGRNTLRATECFCQGYKDGLNGNASKY